MIDDGAMSGVREGRRDTAFSPAGGRLDSMVLMGLPKHEMDVTSDAQ